MKAFRSGVVLDCIDSRSWHPNLLLVLVIVELFMLRLSRKGLIRIEDHWDMTLAVYHER